MTAGRASLCWWLAEVESDLLIESLRPTAAETKSDGAKVQALKNSSDTSTGWESKSYWGAKDEVTLLYDAASESGSGGPRGLQVRALGEFDMRLVKYDCVVRPTLSTFGWSWENL